MKKPTRNALDHGRDESRPDHSNREAGPQCRGGIYAACHFDERGRATVRAIVWALAGAVVMLLLVADPLGVSPVDGWLGLERSAEVGHGDGDGRGTGLWTCGMHPEVLQEEAGICPICQMDLVPVRQDVGHGDGHGDGDGVWTCPMHPDILESEPGSCPICGMDLVEVRQDGGHGNEGREILFYRNPMDPNITSPEPRKDEMGMDYVPVYTDQAVGAGHAPRLPTVLSSRSTRPCSRT